ncbi:MAG: sigma-54-dependent Fis family transcriptional regulator [Acidobacteria bacterium]|nr:MAG: sigma-54-dependent Fis family transcriptional regulator [Acidobacteriota bacterium]
MSDDVTTRDQGNKAQAADRGGAYVLLADDESRLRQVLRRELERRGHRVVEAEDGVRAARAIDRESFDVAVLDIRMPGLDGLEVLRSLADDDGAPEVILLTGNATVESAVEAMKLGAYDFVTKPCRIEVLDALIRAAARKRGLERENERLRRREEHHSAAHDPGVVGWNSRAMKPVLRMIERLAPSELPVLILGESGVGKEIVAREIHRRSRRASGPFVDLSCAAIPDNLLESELFGHEKGAFTGADAPRAGLLEAAHGGTLFLDEIGELPQGLQVKLLRVLETMSFFRVGGRKKITVDVRLVAATNRDLAAESRTGTFRADLYYRINAGTIHVPPLRERREEIEPLARAFLDAVAPGVGIDDDVLAALQAYDWPGNVRELRNVIERASLLARDGRLGRDDLPREIAHAEAAPASAATAGAGTSFSPPPQHEMPGTPRPGASLQELERQRILEVLHQTRWHRNRAAEILGISVRTLYRKIKAYGLDRDQVPVG